ncbi:MAG: hypothetical protein RL291_1921, partial [Pseudomonadota bacterium]
MTWVRLLAIVALFFAGTQPAVAQPQPFDAFVEALWADAKAAGVSRPTFDLAFKGIVPDLTIPDLAPLPGAKEPAKRSSGQAEFTRPPQAYLDKTQLARLAQQGRTLLTKHADALKAIEARYGVEPAIVLAIWGRETSFGQW